MKTDVNSTKRLWAIPTILAVLLIYFATGCKPKTAAIAVTADFACEFTAQYNDLQLAGTMTRQLANTIELEFTKPDSLSGVVAKWDGEQVTFSLHGMSFSVDPQSVPEAALGEEVIACLDAVRRGEVAGELRDSTQVFSGTGKNGAYTLTCDAASGYPQRLIVPAVNLDVSFFNYK